jgi:hypothetical protein
MFLFVEATLLAVLSPLVAESATDPMTYLLQFGVLGIVFILWMTDRLFSAGSVKKIIDAHDKHIADKDEQIKDRDKQIQDLREVTKALVTSTNMRVIPAVEKAVDVVREVPRRSLTMNQWEDLLTRLEQNLAQGNGDDT